MCVRDDGKYYTDDSTYSDDGRDFTKKMDGHRRLEILWMRLLWRQTFRIPKNFRKIHPSKQAY